MARSRDYKAEYRRRTERAAARGLSRSQARGHARVGELPIRRSAAPYDGRFEVALKQYREGGNQAGIAKGLNIAPERLRRFLRENVQIEGRGRSRRIIDDRPRDMLVVSNGEIVMRRLRGFDQASLNGEHLNAVKAFLTSGDIDHLVPFVGRTVIDAKGRAHLLETDPNTLFELAAAGEELFHDVYRLIV